MSSDIMWLYYTAELKRSAQNMCYICCRLFHLKSTKVEWKKLHSLLVFKYIYKFSNNSRQAFELHYSQLLLLFVPLISWLKLTTKITRVPCICGSFGTLDIYLTDGIYDKNLDYMLIVNDLVAKKGQNTLRKN